MHDRERTAMKNTGKIVVIIPCYEPSAKRFIPYVRELAENDISNIIIINDGSGEKYDHVFEEISMIDKVTLISYKENKGKGYALKTAFKHCLDTYGDDVAFVTADCDGQHRIDDVLRVARTALDDKEALVLGVRDFSLPHVPKRSRRGNRITLAVMRALFGIKLTDSQTGLRAFCRPLLSELISVSGDRFEYETNHLIVLYRRNTRFIEVPIETVYEEKESDVETVSHFKSVRDSVRVMGVLFKNLGWYFFSSVISALLDVGIFALLFSFILNIESLTVKTLIATVTARILSSIVNFTCNYKLVFDGKSKRSIFRYYTLWFFQLCLSFGFARLWAAITEIELLVSLLKCISDILLAIFSYQIQANWVFSNRTSRRRFHGPFLRVGKFLFKLVNPSYDASEVKYTEGKPCVFVSNHLNMHACYTIVGNIDFDVHVMVYHVFFTFKDAFKQFSTITFAKNGRVTLASRIKALIPAIFVPLMVRSTVSIPVYRNSSSSLITIREGAKHLINKENVLLFPNIDYSSREATGSEIYKGFLLLERSYYRSCGEHLSFVPLYIDDEERKIYAHPPISFEDGNFHDQLDGIAEMIRAKIGEKP